MDNDAAGWSRRVYRLRLSKGVWNIGVNAVVHGSAATQVAASVSNKPELNSSSAPVATPTPPTPVKKDVAIISEKAKDLAALKAGKGASEEANESMSAKIREVE